MDERWQRTVWIEGNLDWDNVSHLGHDHFLLPKKMDVGGHTISAIYVFR